MNLNRNNLKKAMSEASSELLREKGYISFIDILVKIGKLKREDYENWRFRRIPFLEKAVTINLAKMNFLLRTLHENSRRGGLKPSKTIYMSWGKAPKIRLRFSKSGDPEIEEAYSMHFLKSKEMREETKLNESQPVAGKTESSLQVL